MYRTCTAACPSCALQTQLGTSQRSAGVSSNQQAAAVAAAAASRRQQRAGGAVGRRQQQSATASRDRHREPPQTLNSKMHSSGAVLLSVSRSWPHAAPPPRPAPPAQHTCAYVMPSQMPASISSSAFHLSLAKGSPAAVRMVRCSVLVQTDTGTGTPSGP